MSGKGPSSPSSSSTGTSGLAEPSGGWNLPELKPEHILRIAGAFLASSTLWYLLRYPYSHLVVSAGARVLSSLGGPPVQDMVLVREGGFYLISGLSDPQGKPLIHPLQVFPVHWNLIFFLGLFFLTPLSRLRERWRYLLLASALLALSHVLFFVCGTLTALGELYESRGQLILAPRTLVVLGLLTRTYGVSLEAAIPFLLFMPLLFRRKKTGPRLSRNGSAVGRNDPCPCGSGRKFKRCCGRG